MPRIEPRAAGWDVGRLPLCYPPAPLSSQPLFSSEVNCKQRKKVFDAFENICRKILEFLSPMHFWSKTPIGLVDISLMKVEKNKISAVFASFPFLVQGQPSTPSLSLTHTHTLTPAHTPTRTHTRTHTKEGTRTLALPHSKIFLFCTSLVDSTRHSHWHEISNHFFLELLNGKEQAWTFQAHFYKP